MPSASATATSGEAAQNGQTSGGGTTVDESNGRACGCATWPVRKGCRIGTTVAAGAAGGHCTEGTMPAGGADGSSLSDGASHGASAGGIPFESAPSHGAASTAPPVNGEGRPPSRSVGHISGATPEMSASHSSDPDPAYIE